MSGCARFLFVISYPVVTAEKWAVPPSATLEDKCTSSPFGPDIVALVSNCWEGNNQTVGKETINLRLDPDEVQLHPTQEHPVSLVLGFQVVGDRRCIMPWYQS